MSEGAESRGARLSPAASGAVAAATVAAGVAVYLLRVQIREHLLLPLYRGVQYVIVYVSILPQRAVWIFIVAVAAVLVLLSYRRAFRLRGSGGAYRHEPTTSRYAQIGNYVRSAFGARFARWTLVDQLLTLYLRKQSEIGADETFARKRVSDERFEEIVKSLPPEMAVLAPWTRADRNGRGRFSGLRSLGRKRKEAAQFVESIVSVLDYLEGHGVSQHGHR